MSGFNQVEFDRIYQQLDIISNYDEESEKSLNKTIGNSLWKITAFDDGKVTSNKVFNIKKAQKIIQEGFEELWATSPSASRDLTVGLNILLVNQPSSIPYTLKRFNKRLEISYAGQKRQTLNILRLLLSFGSFFKKRIQKDFRKLEETRERSIGVLRSRGVSEEEIVEIDELSYRRATEFYMKFPDASDTIKMYCESIIQETTQRGYDLRNVSS